MKSRTGIALALGLTALLIWAGWIAFEGWGLADGTSIPWQGWVALGLGAVFSLLVGGGLMALVFYSSRAGYDDEGDGRGSDL